MEGVAASPVHHLDVRIDAFTPIEFVVLARMQQHVGDPGNGDHRAGGIAPRFHGRPRNLHARVSGAVHGGMSKRKTAARQPDMPQCSGKRNAGPVRLFAAMGALQ
ncbi:hypothetical protein D9M69_715630 [compost metagenome]